MSYRPGVCMDCAGRTGDIMSFRCRRCDTAFQRMRQIAVFWATVDAAGGPNACWPWTGHTERHGYGRTSWLGRPARAHRLAFVLTNGPIPGGIFACHHCDNPPCCNPAHLFLGTARDNMQDAASKGRVPGQTGTAHHEARLTAEAVAEIRRAYAAGEGSQRQLGRLFGVTHHQIGLITRGKRWRSTLPTPPNAPLIAARLRSPGELPPLFGRD